MAEVTTTSDPYHPENERKSPWKFRLALLGGLLIPVFLETVDYTVVATAQPHIASAFNRLDLQAWIGTSYLLTSTVFLPLYASFADIFGRHAALQSALFLFLIGSALSTGAQNMPMMLAGRGISGMGAAGFLTVTRIILADSRSLNENSFQTSIMIVLYSVGYSAGPFIGGALTNISFRWVFGINLPAGVAGMILIFVLLRGKIKGSQPSVRKRKRAAPEKEGTKWKTRFLHKVLAIDLVGGALFIGGSIILLLALNWGSTSSSSLSMELGGSGKSGWAAPKVIASLVIGSVLVILTIIWEYLIERYDQPDLASPTILLDAEPILPIPIFKNLDTVVCQYVSLVGGMIMLVMFYFVAIFFTIVSGESATKAGGQLVYFAPGMGVGVYISLIMIKFLRQPKWPIMIGSYILPVSLGLVAMAMERGNIGLVNVFMAISGAGVGVAFGPCGIHARFSQPANRVAVVEGLQLFFRTLGGTIGLAQCATVMNAKVTSGLSDLIRSGILNAADFPNVQSSGSSAASGIVSIQQIAELPQQAQDAIRDVYRNGTRWAFLSLIPWAAIACFGVVFLSNIVDTDAERKKELERERAEARKHTAGEGGEESTDLEDELGPEPKLNKWFGIIGLIIYSVQKVKWGRKKKLLEKRRAESEKADLEKADPEKAQTNGNVEP